MFYSSYSSKTQKVTSAKCFCSLVIVASKDNVLVVAWENVRLLTNSRSCSYNFYSLVDRYYSRDCRAKIEAAVEGKVVELINAATATV